MRKLLLVTAALFGCGLATAQANDIQFSQFEQSAQIYNNYWSVWAENNAPVFGNISLDHIGSVTGALQATTQAIGALNNGTLISTISESGNAGTPSIGSITVTPSMTNVAAAVTAGQSNIMQGLSVVQINSGVIDLSAQPKLTIFAANNANVYGGITAHDIGSLSSLNLSTTAVGAVNTGSITSNVTRTISSLP